MMRLLNTAFPSLLQKRNENKRKTADSSKDAVIGHYINFMVSILGVLNQ
jgi:hypothetical protein